MPRWSPLVLLAAGTLAFPSIASAYTYGDTLTLIWKPLPNLPALVRAGDTLTVWANAPSSASGWSASLQFGTLAFPLDTAGGTWQASRARWELGFRIPEGMLEEVYDLNLGCGTCGPDVSRHAVKVLPAFKSDFYFAQISDTHLPSHAFSSDGGFSTADTSGMPDFNAVIEDLNVLHPEFILHTGDLVNEGELEEYLAMYEMGRAQQACLRLRDPMFLSSGNHDIGGWQATPPPDGTSRKDWWRYFGWPFLGAPPPGDPYHSQDFSFDYGLLHVIGLEAYINNGSYDHYMTNIWGAQSMTAEQMSWLQADVAAVPAGHTKLAFFHYDFGGTLGNGSPAPNFSQFSNPGALGLDGVIWGHYHGVPEGNRAARPFNLGIQSVIYNSAAGGRTFRIFRVHDGAISPGPMHHSGGQGAQADSLSLAWSGPNDGTRAGLSVTVTNRYGETWDHARLVFNLAYHDSMYAATGGTLAQVIRQGGLASVYVDCVLPASGATTVTVAPSSPAGAGEPQAVSLALEPPSPNPFTPEAGALSVRYSIATPGRVRLGVFDLGGRRVAKLFEGVAEAGLHPLSWDGRAGAGHLVPAGVYVVRLTTAAGEKEAKITIVR